MPVYLIVRKSDGFVENAIKWDGESEFDPGAEFDLEQVSGEPGCPWIGWTRDNNGDFQAPPPPVRYAVVRKLGGLVVDFKELEEGASTDLGEPASFEYQLELCEDENVEPGWSFIDGEFVEPA